MVVEKSKKRRRNNLKTVGGKMATDDPEQFKKIIEAVIHQWSLSEPVDIMIANRMVATWMKMKKNSGVIIVKNTSVIRVGRILMMMKSAMTKTAIAADTLSKTNNLP